MEPRQLTKDLVIASDASRVARASSAARASDEARLSEGYGWVLAFCAAEAGLHRMQVETSVSTGTAGAVRDERARAALALVGSGDGERRRQALDPGEQLAADKRHVARADDDRRLSEGPQAGDDPAQRMARAQGLDHESAIKSRQRGVGLGDDNGLQPARVRGIQHVLDQRTAGEQGGGLRAAEPASGASSQHNRDAHLAIVALSRNARNCLTATDARSAICASR
jgi:hypothetical protein